MTGPRATGSSDPLKGSELRTGPVRQYQVPPPRSPEGLGAKPHFSVLHMLPECRVREPG
ncbi:class II, major histocompatibility complex, transactivator, isoform CRA_f [Rattus norvegicus]|uniref:Class II, major histocompatibility complex, transactivator, isoform CRA_f n=1 Tax=Rattus norvegicus TaxID=10116 RepID=A6K4J9_RAT|nr:class II, major histocompatibility complex, transactivator, isoform CRA_f [Rattus norvegicus]